MNRSNGEEKNSLHKSLPCFLHFAFVVSIQSVAHELCAFLLVCSTMSSIYCYLYNTANCKTHLFDHV